MESTVAGDDGWTPTGSFALYVVATVVISLATILWALYQWIKPSYVSPDVPGPPRHPWLGADFTSASARKTDDPPFEWSRWPTIGLHFSRKHKYRTWGGPSLNVGFGGAFFVVANDVDLKHVLADNFDNYIKGDMVKGCLEELVGDGIYASDGPLWKAHRKVITDMFSRDFVKSALAVAAQHLDSLEQILDKASQKPETKIDFQDLCFRYMLDVLGKITLGVELEALAAPEKHQTVLQAFDELQLLCHDRLADLFYSIKKKFGLTRRERRIRHCAKVLDAFFYDLIRQARQEPTTANTLAQDEKKNDETDLNLGPNLITRFLHLTDCELRDMLVTIVLLGRDTIAVTMAWTFYELTQHAAVAKRVLEEVRSSPCTSYETLQRLEYTHAVLLETLRLHPPAPEDFKFNKQADVLPADGTPIPAGSLVMYSPYSINRNTRIWGEHADEFQPERFVAKGEPSAFCFSTFNAGPRICPARTLALTLLKLTLSRLLPKYQLISNHNGDYSWKLVMAMKDGFPVQVQKRVLHS